jgi:Fur family ferric uptake transcriptional regulator
MVEDKTKISARNKFTVYLTEKKLRKTPERFAILDKVFSINDHFDIDTLYGLLEKDSYHVSRATVYNTIELLCDCGLVRRHQFGGQTAKYEKVSINHLHLICSECGKIKEVKDAEFMRYINTRKFPAFTASYFTLYIYGICNACARKAKREAIKKKT